MGTQIITTTNLKHKIIKLVKELDKAPDRYIITRNGKPAATLVSYEEYSSLIATIETLSDPDLVKSIREGKREKQRKMTHSFIDVFGEPL